MPARLTAVAVFFCDRPAESCIDPPLRADRTGYCPSVIKHCIIAAMGNRLGEFEHLVLLALLQLDGAASGTAIYAELENRLKRVPAVPAVYVTLARLETKGLIVSRLDAGGDERAGRRLKHFTITALGRRTLRETRRALESLWKGLSPEYGKPS